MSEAVDWRRHRPLLLPALLLWGWQCDALWVAAAMGLLLEAPRLVRARLDIAQADFDRLWSFTAVLFLGVVFYLLLARQGLDTVGTLFGDEERQEADGLRRVSGTALTFLRWLPYILLPFTAAVAWSRVLVLPWSTFSLYEQARARRQPGVPPPEWSTRPMHPGYLYLAVVAFAATTTPEHPDAILPALLAVLLIALWPWRNRRFGPASWLVLLLWLGGTAYAARFAHQGTRAAWQALEARFPPGGFGPSGDQGRRATAIGAVGRMQLSNAIVLRIAAADGAGVDLLAEATFNRFRGQAWEVAPRPGDESSPAGGRHPPAGEPALTVDRYALPGSTPLALPGDVWSVQPPAGLAVESVGLAAMRVREAPPLVRYRVWRSPRGGIDPPPDADDLALASLAEDDRALFAGQAAAIGLPGLPAAAAVARLEAWFAQGFTYRLWQDAPAVPGSPLRRFLTETRAGHCEYYATASVLLLRAAGVPARYAVGWSVGERAGGQWLARGRDAHAWCQAWVDGAWRVVDATPGAWRAAEAARAPWHQGVSDLASRLWYEFAVWRQYGGAWRGIVLVVGLAVLAWIAWRQLRGSRWRRVAGAAASAPAGLDSELLPVLARLEARCGARPPARTPRAWLAEAGVAAQAGDAAGWAEALALHERLRFDPHGLDAQERARLAALAGRLAAGLRPPPQR